MHLDKEKEKVHNVFDLSTASDEELIQRMESLLSDTSGADNDTQVQAILAELDSRTGNAPAFDAEVKWDELKDQYPLLFEEEPLYAKKNPTPAPHSKRKHLHIAMLAAVLAALIAATGIAQAAGFNIFETIARWSEDIFYFERPSVSEQAAPYARYNSLYDLVASDNADVKVAPAWLPEDMEEQEISAVKTQDGIEYYAVYSNHSGSLSISISNRIDPDAPPYYEKNDGILEVYEVGEIQHYILQNNDTITAVWINQSFECSISTTLSIEAVEQIIDSIYQ